MVDKYSLRIKSKIMITENGCHEWQGCLSSAGYAKIFYLGKSEYVHRVVFLLNGVDLNNLTVDHLCRNRKCINVNHLEPVSSKENILRGISFSAINRLKSFCKNGHEFSYENARHIKNSHQLRECRLCRKAFDAARYLRKKASLGRQIVEGL